MVIFVGSCIFLAVGFAAIPLLMLRICYTAWRDPATTMRDKIGTSVYAIFFLMLEVWLVRLWLPMSDYTYWAIVLLAFALNTLVLRWIEANSESIASVIAEARRREEKP
jgi:hypothetical protein